MLLTILLLVGQITSVDTLKACAPPDSQYVVAWLAGPEPGETGRAQSGVIAGPVRPRWSSTDSANLIGQFQVTRIRAWRGHSSAVDSLYLSSHPPDRIDRAILGLGPTDPVIVGVMNSVLADLDHVSPKSAIFGFPTSIGVAFSVGTLATAEDGDGFRVTSTDSAGFGGWWDGGPSVVPESLAWFCATRLN